MMASRPSGAWTSARATVSRRPRCGTETMHRARPPLAGIGFGKTARISARRSSRNAADRCTTRSIARAPMSAPMPPCTFRKRLESCSPSWNSTTASVGDRCTTSVPSNASMSEYPGAVPCGVPAVRTTGADLGDATKTPPSVARASGLPAPSSIEPSVSPKEPSTQRTAAVQLRAVVSGGTWRMNSMCRCEVTMAVGCSKLSMSAIPRQLSASTARAPGTSVPPGSHTAREIRMVPVSRLSLLSGSSNPQTILAGMSGIRIRWPKPRFASDVGSAIRGD